tara:strand:+ start:719 stop:931 length:213 start_codon:yes stop_codon:yes gene_type:complete
MVEIINCKCGKSFAACTDGMQDEEWREERIEYVKVGCTINFVDRQDFNFESCDCPKTEKQILERTQLNLF